MTMTGTKILKATLILLLLGGLARNSAAQEIGISFSAFPSPGYNMVFEPGMNGGSAAVFFHTTRYRVVNFSISGEYAISGWGHETFLGIGINKTWWSINRFEMNTYAHMLNGLALFMPKSLYIIGVDTRAVFNYFLYHDIKLFAGIGIRYTVCPEYGNYGLFETILDLPVEIGLKYTW